MTDTGRARKFWGWGYEGEGPNRQQTEAIATGLAARLGVDRLAVADPPTLDAIELPASRLEPPASLAAICTTDKAERAGHTYGKSYRDVVRGFSGDFSAPPDVVALPRNDSDIVALLDWCSDTGAAAIPCGGGSSVVGGVEPGAVAGDHPGVVTIDLRRLDQVVEI